VQPPSALAQCLPVPMSPYRKSEHEGVTPELGKAGRVVVRADEAAVLAGVYELLGRIAERVRAKAADPQDAK
jgi:hypothetical protein